jgi:hypothetical protein
MRKIEFICPECGGTEIESDAPAMVAYRLIGVEDDGRPIYDVNNPAISALEDNDQDYGMFRCASCGTVLVEGTDQHFADYAEKKRLIGNEIRMLNDRDTLIVDGACLVWSPEKKTMVLDFNVGDPVCYMDGKEVNLLDASSGAVEIYGDE